MIEFRLNGRRFRPNDFRNALEQAMVRNIEAQIRDKIGDLRDPETGAQPKLIMSGKSLDSLSIEVEGTPYLIEQVKARLGGDQ
jgi:hypothetical protein